MKRRYVEATFLAIVLLAIAALAAYTYIRRHDSSAGPTAAQNSVGPKEQRDEQYSKDTTGLRDRFNQDKGKVRLLLLLSPS